MHNPNNRKAVRLSLENQLTHLCNRHSQKAIEQIGAVKEGILRIHMVLPMGHYRLSVFYSLLYTDWPKVKKRLRELMQR